MEIMGFGWLLVSGLSLVPFPPAMMTAFIRPFSPRSIRDRIILPERTLLDRAARFTARIIQSHVRVDLQFLRHAARGR